MAKKFNCAYEFSEIECAKKCFNFTKDIRSYLYLLSFVAENNQKVIKLIIKYLIHHEKVEPQKVEQIIRRYSILFIYSYLKDICQHNISIKHFDDLLNNDLSINGLLDDPETSNNEILIDLYLKNNPYQYNELVDLLGKEIEYLKNKNKKDNFEKRIKSMISLLKKDNHFFTAYKKSKIRDLRSDNARSFDQLIAENIDNSDFYQVKIKVEQDHFENYKNNYITNVSPKNIKSRFLLYIAILTLDLIKNDNHKLSKKIDMTIFNNSDLFLEDRKSSCTKVDKTIFKFLEKNGNIIPEKISPFEYTLNNKRYILSNEGLKELG